MTRTHQQMQRLPTTDRLGLYHDWWYETRMAHAENRAEQAIDDDFVDGIQYSDEDLRILEERGQSAISFNEVGPAVRWVLGTEKRTRLDYKVLPRTDDDREGATVKTRLVKYVDDANKATFARSQAFEDAVRVGCGWLELGINSDAEREPLVYRAESWRNVWLDPLSRARDPNEDSRFLFRSKVLDLDIAIALFPAHEAALRLAAASQQTLAAQADEDYHDSLLYQSASLGARVNVADALGYSHRQRQVVRLVECWYREPKQVQVLRGGRADGLILDPRNPALMRAVQLGESRPGPALRMMMNLATFIDGGALLQDVPSPYRHNRFPLVPVWGYRRGRDNAAYGIVRDARGPQEDLNKRRSKALFLLSVNRTIMDEGAVDDLDEYEAEAARPNAVIVKRPNKELRIENNVQLADQHVMLAQQSADYVRQTAGVTGENLGLDTNANSGKAILARQNQGSVVTATLFDNLRFAMQLAGEIELSLIEQFYSESKIIRLTDERGGLEFLQVNQPQPDGSILNDITASQADFIVSEQDYRESVRLAMFEQMMQMLGQMAPDLSIKFLDQVIEWSDLPGKDEMVRRIRQINGYPDPDDPGAQQLAEQNQQAQAEEARKMAELERRALEAKVKRDEAAAAQGDASAQGTKVKSMIDALQAAQVLLSSLPMVAEAAQDVLEGADEIEPGRMAVQKMMAGLPSSSQTIERPAIIGETNVQPEAAMMTMPNKEVQP